MSDPPSTAKLGTGFAVDDTTANQGGAAASKATTTRYYLSLNAVKSTTDKLLTGYRTVAALGAGEASTGRITVTVPTTTVAGTYYLLACADGGSALYEGVETNNCAASVGMITVGL